MKKKNTDTMIMHKKNVFPASFLLVLLYVILPKLSFAQQLNLPLGEYFQKQTDYEINKSNKIIHSGFKPLLKSKIDEVIHIDSVIYKYQKRNKFFKKHKKNIFWRKLMFEDFISIKKENFSFCVNPLFYLEKGFSKDSDNSFINTRGIELKGTIGKKISYYSSFRENQARFRSYIYDWSWERLVVPGQGAFKKNNNDLSIVDFSSASAYLSYSPVNWLNVQIGQDKHFVGEGHRSLLLSDNAFHYPFLKISADFFNFKYTTMFTEFRDFENSYYDYHTKKHGAFNFLSFTFGSRFEIGLFEGIIYRTTDTSEYVNKFKPDYFIPVPAIRTVVNGFASEHKLIAGMNLKLKATDHIQLYGQTAIDDPMQRKIAFQGGFKLFDLFHSKFPEHQFFAQAEINYARPRTYSHHNLKYQTWSHYNQELAHPAGSDFKEFFVTLIYSFHSFSLDYRYMNIRLNNKKTFSNIYVLDNVVLLSPEPIKIIHHTVHLEYTLNPRTGLQIYIGNDFRRCHSDEENKENFFMFGLRTRLGNYRYEF